MTFNVFSGISALQTAVSTRLSEWSGAVASNVLGQVQGLSHWDNIGMTPPASLTDLAHPRTAVHLLLSPHFAHSVCRIIGVDTRTVIGREMRSNRLLPHQSALSATLTLTDHLHSVPSAKLVLLLQKHPGVRLFIAREDRPEARLTPSIIAILMMGIKQGENVTFRAEGEGANEVLRQIQKYNSLEWFNGDRRRSQVDIRDIQGTGIGGIVWQVLEAMEQFEEKELAAIYHPQTRRLVVGHILSTHREIAKSAGFEDSASYHRMNLDARGGHLQACFAPGEDRETKNGKNYLQEWLSELFRGVRVVDQGITVRRL